MDDSEDMEMIDMADDEFTSVPRSGGSLLLLLLLPLVLLLLLLLLLLFDALPALMVGDPPTDFW